MSQYTTAKVTIRGLRSLLWHAFGPDAMPLEKQERTGIAGNDPEEWKKTVLATKDGDLYIPGAYIFSCFRDAAKHTKKGRGSIQANVAATLQIMDDIITIGRRLPDGELPRDPSEPVYLDVRGVRNPATKGRNVRYRVAASAGWEATFRIMWDRTIVSTQEMKAVVTDAGPLSGLGDGRSIGFGRFELVAFETGD